MRSCKLTYKEISKQKILRPPVEEVLVNLHCVYKVKLQWHKKRKLLHF